MRGTADLGEAFAGLHACRHFPAPSRKIRPALNLATIALRLGARILSVIDVTPTAAHRLGFFSDEKGFVGVALPIESEFV